MAELPIPLRALLDVPEHVEAGARSELERADNDALAARLVHGGRARYRARRRRRATLAASALGALGVWAALRVGARGDVGPLRRAAGEPLEATISVATTPLSDGSQISLAAHTRLRVGRNDGAHFDTRLEQGRARFSVRPGGPRRWRVDCEGVLVEVVGTVFSVEREPDAVRVAVEHGRVRVDGRALSSDVSLLTDGQSARIFLHPMRDLAPQVTRASASASREVSPRESRAHEDTPHSSSGPMSPAAIDPSPRRAARVASTVATRDDGWRRLARDGDYRGAYEALGPHGVESAVPASTEQDLLALADVARLSGHPSEAVAPLERLLRDHPNAPSASLAAITLARIELDTLHQPARAAQTLERALGRGVPTSLDEDARARLVEALAASGRTDAAREAARAYLERYPSGRRAGAVQRWGALP